MAHFFGYILLPEFNFCRKHLIGFLWLREQLNNMYCPKRTVIANKVVFWEVKKISPLSLCIGLMCGKNFLVDTHQEVTAANQERFYSKVVFPLKYQGPSLANKGCGWLRGGGTWQKAEFHSKCNRRWYINRIPV